MLSGTRDRDRRYQKSARPPFFLQGMPLVVCICFYFSGSQATRLELLKQEHAALIFIMESVHITNCLRQPRGRLLPYVFPQRVTAPRPPPLTRPGCAPMGHQHLLVLLIDLLVLVLPLFLLHRGGSAMLSSCLCCVFGEEGCWLNFSPHSTRSFPSSLFRLL